MLISHPIFVYIQNHPGWKEHTQLSKVFTKCFVPGIKLKINTECSLSCFARIVPPVDVSLGKEGFLLFLK